MPTIDNLGTTAYYDLLREYVYSCSIRIARDMFALLPVKNVIVHAVDNQKTILSTNFDRDTLRRIKFGFNDALSIINRFNHNVVFDEKSGFNQVEQIG